MRNRKRSPVAFMLPIFIPLLSFIVLVILFCLILAGNGFSSTDAVTLMQFPAEIYQAAYEEHCIDQYPSMGELMAYVTAYLEYKWDDFDPQIIRDIAQKAREAKSRGQTFDFKRALEKNSYLYDLAYQQFTRITENLIGFYLVEEDIEVEDEIPAQNSSPDTDLSPESSETYSENNDTIGNTIKVTRVIHKTYEVYGVKSYFPIPKKAIDSNRNTVQEFYFNHVNDFGASRTYGGDRNHEGNDIMAPEGTPIVAVEEGKIERMGWGELGGYNIKIRSLDGQRIYYYAHLYKDHPFSDGLKEGDTVTAGQVIGFVGRTGYSPIKGTNGPFESHLHFQIGYVEPDRGETIYIDPYPFLNFLYNNKRAVLLYNSEYDYTLDIHKE